MRQYIAATTTKYNTIENHVSAPLFRRIFDCAKRGDSVLEISAAGFYRVFLNGKELTKGFFAPYISNPDQVIYYDEYSLDDILRDKGNELLVLLGNGFNNSNDCGIWEFDKASFRSAPKFYLAIRVDGEQILTTDEQFEVCDSPITFDDLRCGEHYDARLGENLFASPAKPVFTPMPKGEYRKCMAHPIVIEKELTVKEIIKGNTGFLYDFGENNTGLCRLQICASEGQEIDMTFCEMRDKNEPDQRNLRFRDRYVEGYVQHDRYICKEGEQTYMPSFTYHGFRYVYIEGITEEQATESLLTYLVIHSDIKTRATFACSNEIINQIQECVVRTDKANYHYFLTDCPHREKNGWTGDVAATAEQVNYNFDTYASAREWLHTVRKAQLESGQIPGIIPTSGWGYEWGSGLIWDSVLVELPYQLYRFSGKIEIVEENIETIWKYLGYMRSMENESGLFDYGLGDWCEAGAIDETVSKTPLEVVISLASIDLLAKAEFLFQVAGQEHRADDVKQYMDTIRKTFRDKYIVDDAVSCMSQTAQSMALALNVFEECEQEQAYRKLLEIIEEDGRHIRFGFTGARHLFDVLSKFGDTQLALELIVGPEFPSYGYCIQDGATTLWEMFCELAEEDGRKFRIDGNPAMLSMNHPAFGSVSSWFYRRLAGLHVISAQELLISPCIDCNLDWVEAEYENEYGEIKILWKRQKDDVVLKVTNHGFTGKVQSKYLLDNEQKEIILSEGTTEYFLGACM